MSSMQKKAKRIWSNMVETTIKGYFILIGIKDQKNITQRNVKFSKFYIEKHKYHTSKDQLI